MPVEKILHLLKQSGFHVQGWDGSALLLEDPACIFRSVNEFIGYAWIAISVITAFLLLGWAISLIRGVKTDIAVNIRNLAIVFGVLAAAKPAAEMIWGGNLWTRGCNVIRVPIAEVQKILAAKNSKLKSKSADQLYEEFDIWDSGTGEDVSLAELETQMQLASAPDGGGILIIPGTAPISGGAAGSGATASLSVGKEVIYTNPDGSKYKKVGGTLAWRNNNPGNIEFGDFAKRIGAIGRNGRFAVFPGEAVGMRSIKNLLRTKNYQNKTIGGAIARWAPPTENDTGAYQRHIERTTGLAINTPMNSLTDVQLDSVANAIKIQEGWKAGKIEGA